ncbi:MAG TPA: helix-turn-helix transcriptional regulator [Gammaproteobacteria bacterium]|nr:helix-turn-helix transcriptional regulator [Gammaproteobacteria bacterium]
MKKHPISAHSHGQVLYISHRHTTYAIPKNVANKYVVVEGEKTKKLKSDSKTSGAIKRIFEILEKKYTRAGALLKGLRLREGLSQLAFAKKISVTQANLSAMETGKRPIGKIIAKRIEKVFGTDYRYFLG